MDKLADHVRRTRAAWNGQAADDEQPRTAPQGAGRTDLGRLE
jgi:hypothetical protein